MTYQPALPVVGRPIDSLRAIQLAFAKVLTDLRIVSMDLIAFLASGREESRIVSLASLRLDWSKRDGALGYPSAVVRLAGRLTYDSEVLNAVLDEDAPVRRVATAVAPMDVDFLAGHPDDRAGLRAALEAAFLAEPDRHAGDRVIEVPEYGGSVRLRLDGLSHGDNEGDVRADEWALTAHFTATAPVLTRIRELPEFRPRVVIVHEEE